jgi:hypothetical protein
MTVLVVVSSGMRPVIGRRWLVVTFGDCKVQVCTELNQLYDYWELTYIRAPRRWRSHVPIYKIWGLESDYSFTGRSPAHEKFLWEITSRMSEFDWIVSSTNIHSSNTFRKSKGLRTKLNSPESCCPGYTSKSRYMFDAIFALYLSHPAVLGSTRFGFWTVYNKT